LIDLGACDHDPSADAKCTEFAALDERVCRRATNAKDHGYLGNRIRPASNVPNTQL